MSITTGANTHLEDFFHEKFRFPVWVGAVTSRMVLVYRKVLGLPVDSGAGAKDDLVDVELRHDLEEVDAARHVVLIVLEGESHGLSDALEGSEVNDGRDPTCAGGELFKHSSDLLLCSKISIEKRNCSSRQPLQFADHV